MDKNPEAEHNKILIMVYSALSFVFLAAIIALIVSKQDLFNNVKYTIFLSICAFLILIYGWFLSLTVTKWVSRLGIKQKEGFYKLMACLIYLCMFGIFALIVLIILGFLKISGVSPIDFLLFLLVYFFAISIKRIDFHYERYRELTK